MKAAISGSRGFIGSHLAEALKNKGYEVVPIKRELLLDREKLAELFAVEKPDYTFHLASYGNHFNQQDIMQTLAVNIFGLITMLQASNAKTFINFSSSSVTLDVETFYSASKAAGERIAKAFAQQGKHIVTLRPYSIYGPGEASFRFIPTVIRCLLTGERMTLDLGSHHDWVYVEDFINGVIAHMDSKEPIVSLGTGKTYSNIEVVKILEEISRRTLNYISGVPRPYDNDRWVSVHPTVKSDIRVGLQKTWLYYRKLYEE